MDKIIIWGTGKEYKRLKNRIMIAENEEYIRVIACVNKDVNERNDTIDGHHRISSYQITDYEYDKIIVCTEKKNQRSIWDEVDILGIDPQKVEVGDSYFKKIMPDRFNLKVSAKIKDGYFFAEVKSDIEVIRGYHFHLYRNNDPIGEVLYSEENRIKIQLYDSGLYYIFVYESENGMKAYSVPLEYIEDKDRKCFYDFLKEREELKEIPLCYFKPPFYDWCISNKDIGNEIHGIKRVYSAGYWEIYSATSPKIIRDAEIILSGELVTKKLYLGQDDVDEEIERRNLAYGRGGYSAIVFSEDEIEIWSDYFGIGKIYFYKSNEIIVLSNHYHLLLLALQKAGINLELDEENALSNLFCTHMYFGEQPLSATLTMRGGYMLRTRTVNKY